MRLLSVALATCRFETVKSSGVAVRKVGEDPTTSTENRGYVMPLEHNALGMQAVYGYSLGL